jgi:hypothetical protein
MCLFDETPDHRIAFAEPGHLVLGPTPEPAACDIYVINLLHNSCQAQKIANTAVPITGIGVYVFFFPIHLQGRQSKISGSPQKKPSGTLVMNPDTYRCGHEQI